MLMDDLLCKINKSKRPALVRFLRERNWSDTRVEILAGNPTTPREDHGVIMIMVICHNLYDPSGEKWDAWCIHDSLQDGKESITRGGLPIPDLMDLIPECKRP
jgi:hypothetical protein